MLHPKNNRIDYGEQLIPPSGYEFSCAIGTTYSLDLEALMILPVALFYAQKLDGNADELRYDMLDAITKAADKITVYYQKSQLKVPQKYHQLMAYWEKGIQPVTMPTYDSSFHPKVWIIRYESKEAPHKPKKALPRYRVLVTSRNLTFNRDWDIAFTTDGIVTDIEQPENKPLIHFLEYLDKAGSKRISNTFLKDLMKVKFDLPDKFDTLRFVPVGIPDETGKIYNNPITKERTRWNEMLVISPFVDKTTLENIRKATIQKPYLLSRKDEMDGVDESTLGLFNCWQFNTLFQKAEFNESLEDGGGQPFAQDLHAKLFVTMQKHVPYWYIGSANCSDPAQCRNVEFMVELKARRSTGLKPIDIYDAFTNSAKSDNIPLFTQYQSGNNIEVKEQQKLEDDIRKIKYELSRLSIKGKAVLTEGSTHYKLIIDIDASELKLSEGFEIRIRPLPEKKKSGELLIAGQANLIESFEDYPETALSIFLVFEIIKDGNRCSEFLLPMEIALPESRLNRIFTAIIDSRDKFLKYLTFLLTSEETDLIKNADGIQKNLSANNTEVLAFAGTPIYEKLLIASSRFPEKLKSINALIQRIKAETIELDEPIITKDFEDFWGIFQTFMKNKQ